MRYVAVAIFSIIVGCSSTPTVENRCCTDGTCSIPIREEKLLCLERLTDSLESELKILKLKMHYECKEAK